MNPMPGILTWLLKLDAACGDHPGDGSGPEMDDAVWCCLPVLTNPSVPVEAGLVDDDATSRWLVSRARVMNLLT